MKPFLQATGTGRSSLICSAAFLFCGLGMAAQTAPAKHPGQLQHTVQARPKLVVMLVVDQMRASGLSVGSVSSNRTIVDATGPVSAVEAVFAVTISDWHDRDQNRDFFGNETEPTLPAAERGR